jgi:DNA-binding response OmpR family regulator
MGEWAKARIQLCGRFAVDIDGSRIEDSLPGRRGRVLFAYLALNRGRALPREELLMAGWGEETPAESARRRGRWRRWRAAAGTSRGAEGCPGGRGGWLGMVLTVLCS